MEQLQGLQEYVGRDGDDPVDLGMGDFSDLGGGGGKGRRFKGSKKKGRGEGRRFK